LRSSWRKMRGKNFWRMNSRLLPYWKEWTQQLRLMMRALLRTMNMTRTTSIWTMKITCAMDMQCQNTQASLPITCGRLVRT